MKIYRITKWAKDCHYGSLNRMSCNWIAPFYHHFHLLPLFFLWPCALLTSPVLSEPVRACQLQCASYFLTVTRQGYCQHTCFPVIYPPNKVIISQCTVHAWLCCHGSPACILSYLLSLRSYNPFCICIAWMACCQINFFICPCPPRVCTDIHVHS